MPTLRHLVCEDCGTAFAVADDPSDCPRCGGPLTPLATDPGAERYFSRGLR